MNESAARCDRHGLGSIARSQFFQKVLHVNLDGLLGDEQFFCDIASPIPIGDGVLEAKDWFANFNGLAPRGTPLYQTPYGNVAPRFGLAWQLGGRQNWGATLRGGFGIFYDLAVRPLDANAGEQSGVRRREWRFQPSLSDWRTALDPVCA